MQDTTTKIHRAIRALFARFAGFTALSAGAFVVANAQAAAVSGPLTPASSFFPIAVYRQPVSTFTTWKARGVNTVIDFYAPGAWQEYWNDAAVADGLWMIRNPRENPAQDINQPYLLAWEMNDEPDINGVSTASVAATYAAWKAADPNRKVIVNVSGANAIYQFDSLTDAMYTRYTASADIISSDVYPLNTYNRPQWIDKNTKLTGADPENASTTPFNPGQSVDKLRALSGGKEQYAYIETSYQGLTNAAAKGARGPTADEVRGETWDSIINGAKGVIYFPFTFPDTPDGTPASVAAGITSTDALITDFGSVLASRSNSNPNYLNLPGGLEATYVNYGGHTYYFVLNFSHTAVNNVTFSLPGVGNSKLNVTTEGRSVQASNGSITDSFTDYGVHIYEM